MATSLEDRINRSVAARVAEFIDTGGFRHYTGQASEELGRRLAEQFGHSHCVLTSSGTAALEIALRSTERAVAAPTTQQHVLLSGYDYPGNIWAIERAGARPVLVDTRPQSWKLDLQRVADILDGPLGNACKAVVASHLHGELQEIEQLSQLCSQRDLMLVEDSCQAVRSWNPANAGADVMIVSFGGGKLLSTGRGGAMLTSDAALAQRARLAAGAGSGPYGLSEAQAVIALAQLPFLDELNHCCREFFGQLIADEQMQQLMDRSRLDCPWTDCRNATSFYQAGFLLASESGVEAVRQRVVDVLVNHGLPAGTGFSGFHRRSRRRCETPFPLEHVPQLTGQTLVLHHRLATQGKWTPSQVAERLHDAIDAGARRSGE